MELFIYKFQWLVVSLRQRFTNNINLSYSVETIGDCLKWTLLIVTKAVRVSDCCSCAGFRFSADMSSLYKPPLQNR